MLRFYADDSNDRSLVYVLRCLIVTTNAEACGSVPEPARVVSRLSEPHFLDLAYVIPLTRCATGRRFAGNADAVGALVAGLRGPCPRAVQVLMGVVLSGRDRDAVGRLERVEVVTQILETGLGAPAAFRAIIVLCNISSNDGSCGRSAFDTIIDVLDANCGRLAAFVRCDGAFAGGKRFAMELVTAVTATKDAPPPCAAEVAAFLWDLACAQTTNNFLHLAFLGLFQAMSAQSRGFGEFVAGTGLVAMIGQLAETAEQPAASFWGLIHRVAGLVDGAVPCATLVQDKRWRAYMDNAFRRDAAVANAPFGGPVPRPFVPPGADSDGLDLFCKRGPFYRGLRPRWLEPGGPCRNLLVQPGLSSATASSGGSTSCAAFAGCPLGGSPASATASPGGCPGVRFLELRLPPAIVVEAGGSGSSMAR